MKNKILVVLGLGYGTPLLDELGKVTPSVENFLEAPEDYKLVLFTGGEDISPELYGDTSPRGYCGNNLGRDKFEIRIFKHALSNGIPMTGICRGSQFLNVMCGGRMMHHISHHGSCVHKTLTATGIITTNSYHHQMCVPGNEGKIVAVSQVKRSSIYVGTADKEEDYFGPEVEGILYPKEKCFGVQWHPEAMDAKIDGSTWYVTAVRDLLEMNMDEFIGKYSLNLSGEKVGVV